MKLYMTKVFGFDEPVGPLQFSERGWREAARKVLQEGDLVALVGTFGELTDEISKGRLLGMMEPTTEPVSALDFSMTYLTEKHFDVAGNYKWPFGLHIKQAWTFPAKPRFVELVPRKFSMNSAMGIVPLTEVEALAVLAQPRREAQLLKPSARFSGRSRSGRVSRNSPAPSTSRRGIMHMRDARAVTYVLKILESRPANRLMRQPRILAYKIGWAFDLTTRTKLFNRHAMAGLGGLWYEPMAHEYCETARQAYRLEQELLKHFSQHRHADNHEIVFGIREDEMFDVFRRLALAPRNSSNVSEYANARDIVSD